MTHRSAIAWAHHYWYKITMSRETWTAGPIWTIPLYSPCRVRWMGVSVHGERPVDRYRMLNFWSVHFYTYHGTLCVGDAQVPIRPRFASIQPPNLDMEWRFAARECLHLCAHFTFPDAGKDRAGVPVPTIQDLGDEFDSFNADMRHAIGAFGSRPRRAECRVWDILWRLAERANAAPGDRAHPPAAAHPAMIQALRYIEEHLHEDISVRGLADIAEISHNHLTRLFRHACLTTVVGYIRQRRVERARHLLAGTTLPIKAIAREVGISDPHLFNKVIRRALGAPPSAMRARAHQRQAVTASSKGTP